MQNKDPHSLIGEFVQSLQAKIISYDAVTVRIMIPRVFAEFLIQVDVLQASI
jgi:hypothetical protein